MPVPRQVAFVDLDFAAQDFMTSHVVFAFWPLRRAYVLICARFVLGYFDVLVLDNVLNIIYKVKKIFYTVMILSPLRLPFRHAGPRPF